MHSLKENPYTLFAKLKKSTDEHAAEKLRVAERAIVDGRVEGDYVIEFEGNKESLRSSVSRPKSKG